MHDLTTKLKVEMLLTILDVSKQELATEIGEAREVVSDILSGKRKAEKVRPKLARALSDRVERLILPIETA